MKWILLAVVAGVVGAGPATKPANVHSIEEHDERIIRDMFGPNPRGAMIEQVRAAVRAQDKKLSQYLATHEVDDRVKAAAVAVKPCPTMSEEVLRLIGLCDAPTVETETGKTVIWSPYGYSYSTDWYSLRISDGVVREVRPFSGPAGERHNIP